MAKFVIECPQCGNSVEASNFIFARKKIPCSCGYVINIKTDSLASKLCPHCGNTVVYDQRKGEKAKCPVCHELINTNADRHVLSEFTCPTCSCKLSADRNASLYECPLCGTSINVQERIAKEKVKKEGVISVVKYEGGDNILVWKHPVEDFNMGSQLIVHESQEAIFFRDGKALDLFGSGRYTLSTQYLPGLENLYKLPTNTTEYFHSEVYFINTAVIMGIKWGTDSKVRVLDPATGIPLELGASGEFNIKVTDARKLLLKVVGTTGGLTSNDVIEETGGVDIKAMSGKFRALIMNKVKSILARSIRENAISILEIDGQLDVLSTYIQEQINIDLQEYGLHLPGFFITTILTPDDDPNFKRLKQQGADQYLKVNEERIRKSTVVAAGEADIAKAEADARVKLIGADADAQAYRMQATAEADEMKMKGYTYQQETGRQVGVGAVTTEHGTAGGSGAIGDIAGIGIGLGVMKEVIDMTKSAMSPPEGKILEEKMADAWDCPKCGAKGITAKFCGECGAAKPVAWDCPKCGAKGITAKFCGECGAAKPVAWDCPKCGAKGITAKFCGECGAAKPEISEAE